MMTVAQLKNILKNAEDDEIIKIEIVCGETSYQFDIDNIEFGIIEYEDEDEQKRIPTWFIQSHRMDEFISE